MIYANEDLSDSLKRKLAATSFNAHIERLANEGIIIIQNNYLINLSAPLS